jgi:hypothetical protein
MLIKFSLVCHPESNSGQFWDGMLLNSNTVRFENVQKFSTPSGSVLATHGVRRLGFVSCKKISSSKLGLFSVVTLLNLER